MVTVNSLSGGKTSSYMGIHYPADVNIFACICIDYPRAAPKDPAVLKYCLDKLNGNFIASAEHEKTLKLMMQLEQLLGKEIVWVRGESFDEVIDNAGCLPTWNRRFCTTDMKIQPMFEYLYFKYGVTKTQIGIRYDEFDRAYITKEGKLIKKEFSTIDYPILCRTYGNKSQKWVKNFVYQQKTYPLIDNVVFHHQIKKYWEDRPEFDFPLDSNCRGCHHKPEWLIKKNWEETPDILEWFAEQERKKARKKAKFYTFKDSGIMYEEIFATQYIDLFSELKDFTMCNSGNCTD